MQPEILDRAGPLLANYDVLLCDIWGVLHSGGDVHPEAADTLRRFRAKGGTVILVSNAPMAADAVGRLLEGKKLEPSAWDAIVCSGEIALAHIASQGYAGVHRIGPQKRDASFFDRLSGPDSPLDKADAIACTGLVDDRRETADAYLPILRQAVARKLPFVCANPDLVVEVRGVMLPCAGAIGTLYEQMGGAVYWAGKPHPAAYESALAQAARLRKTPMAANRVLAIGDAVRTDLAAARDACDGAGVDALFVTSGIHREAVMDDGRIVPERLAALLAEQRMPARAAIAALRW
jgi:HAD superfamily hydrolase (TIGR01459 family)